MRVSVTNLQDLVRLNVPRVRRAVRFVATQEGEHRDFSAVFVDDERIAQLNKRFLGCTGPTDVIAFVLDGPGDPDELLGEVVISAETALAQARRRHIAVERELLLYTIHGVLHLVGYDDTTDTGARRMRRRQAVLLNRFLRGEG
jgi:probable rRNA maturation factor